MLHRHGLIKPIGRPRHREIGQEKKVDLILAINDESSFHDASTVFKKVLRIPDVPLGRVNQIKMAIIQALSKGLVKKGDKWVCLSGIPQTKVLDNLLILEFGKEFEIISSSDLPVISEIVRPEVFETVLSLALEISIEGKEGRKPVGRPCRGEYPAASRACGRPIPSCPGCGRF